MSKPIAFEIIRTNKTTGKTYRHKVNGVSTWKLANAKAIARELHEKGHAARVRRYVPPIKRVLPERVLSWKKWTKVRGQIRRDAEKWGMTLTSGDRDYNSLAGVGRVSDHYTKVTTSWADDYWHVDEEVMCQFAAYVGTKYSLKQVLVHDAGTGDHVHIADEV